MHNDSVLEVSENTLTDINKPIGSIKNYNSSTVTDINKSISVGLHRRMIAVVAGTYVNIFSSYRLFYNYRIHSRNNQTSNI